MAENVTNTTDETEEPQSAAEQAQATTPTGGGEEPGTAERMFTQDELNAIVGERARHVTNQELAKLYQGLGVGDAKELKRLVQQQREADEARLSELEKAQKRAAEAEHARDVAMAQAKDTLIRAAFIGEASKRGVLHPDDAYALADRRDVTLDETGKAVGVAEQVQALVDAGRLPTQQVTRAQAPALDGGAGGTQRPAEHAPALSPDELKAAKRMGISPEKYAERKKAIGRS